MATLDLSVLSVRDIRRLLRGQMTVPRSVPPTRDSLVKYIVENANFTVQTLLRDAILVKEGLKQQKAAGMKRKRADDQRDRRTVQRLEAETSHLRDTSQFLLLPSETQIKSCYSQFYAATSNTALATAVCGVCARELNIRVHCLKLLRLLDIPHTNRLVPRKSNPDHDLVAGKLIEPAGVVGTQCGEETKLHVCRECLTDLQAIAPKAGDMPPRLSLANNLWIGRVPWQLQTLTMPEQMLIALLFPRVYVFKLYPKDLHFHPDTATLQRGLRGNVSTYELDVEGAAAMIQGRLMPQPMSVLPSVIAITFIGRGEMSRHSLKPVFRVRRYTVADALQWLKTHNSRYYGDIKIDPERLQQLPQDDVPDELMAVVRQSTDTGIIDQESSGYVQEQKVGTEDESETVARDQFASEEEEVGVAPDSADVIPLAVSGTIDTDLSRLTANEMMLWGLANLWDQGLEGGYSVRHGRLPVSDFGRPRKGSQHDPAADLLDNQSNFFEKAYPCLFPYGQGGIEGEQPVPLSFREHVQWALQYFDRRFRKHETFPFLTFGILQRREALGSAQVQMRRQNFEREANIMTSVTQAKLRQAHAEEESGVLISDPAVRLLRHHVNATIARVVASDQTRLKMRSQIWSTAIHLGPPYVWLTINPSDLHDPIAQVFAGEHIDLDNFAATMGPEKDTRARNIASDPYAAAKYFHFMIQVILETLFQVKVSKFKVDSGKGIFGEVTAYFGTVEAQGRGTLHLHMLLWLKHAPSSDEITELLKSEVFRSKVIAFIRANFCAYLPGLETAASVKQVPCQHDIAYNRPLNPDSPDYDDRLRQFELALARSEQLHTCKPRRCLVPDKHGRLSCKRKAPFECSQDDYVTETGKWGPKRLYAYMNGWVPGILVNARCNNDGKFLTNGGDTKNITFYVTSYAAKKQGKHYNLSAILADGFAFHLDHPHPDYVSDIRQNQRLLLFRLVHAINREQELSAPMVMSYLMDWGDTYRSHSYSIIFWSSFVRELLRAFPELQQAARQVYAPSTRNQID